MADVFVSYTSKDRDWAFWIGQELARLGHKPHIHEWEIAAGGNIVGWMDKRLQATDHVLCVVSAAYLTKDYSSWELQAAQWAAAGKRPSFTLPVLIEDCELPPLLAPFRRCDLFGLSEENARERLANYLAPVAPPEGPVGFPGGARLAFPALPIENSFGHLVATPSVGPEQLTQVRPTEYICYLSKSKIDELLETNSWGTPVSSALATRIPELEATIAEPLTYGRPDMRQSEAALRRTYVDRLRRVLIHLQSVITPFRWSVPETIISEELFVF